MKYLIYCKDTNYGYGYLENTYYIAEKVNHRGNDLYIIPNCKTEWLDRRFDVICEIDPSKPLVRLINHV